MSEQERIDDLAVTALARFGLSPDATATLCNVSENHTYRVDDPASGRRFALRVHRAGYRTAQQIESELQWVDALREDGAVDTCVPVPAPDGERVVEVSADGLGARNVVAVRVAARQRAGPRGRGGDRRLPHARRGLGAHARARPRVAAPPQGFDRPAWDYERTLGAGGHWGAWQDGLGMGAEERAAARPPRRRDRGAASRPTGRASDRFGLVHADIRLANLLVDDGHVRVIDFDDCRVRVVHVRLRHHGVVHGGPPARARAARGVARGLPLGRAAGRRPTRPSSTRS